MIRALFTGVSGLRSNQVRMDVIGNNIANVNTTAFKRGRAAFNEVLGQELVGTGRTTGGNPAFVGLGARVASIDQNWGQGGLQRTDIATDLALNGDGFFVASAGNRQLLTRAGNFTFNRDGAMITSDGLNVQGWTLKEDGEVDMSRTRDIQVNWGAQSPPKYTEGVMIAGNLSSEAKEGATESVSGAVYDEQGVAHNAILTYTKTANANEWSYEVIYGGDLAPPPFSNIPVTGTLTFDVDGALAEMNGVAVRNPDGTPAMDADGTPLAKLTVDWDGGYVGPDGSGTPSSFDLKMSGVTQYSGSSTVLVRDQDGRRAGVLEGYDIDQKGVLSLQFSNGLIEPIYQLAIANVNNANGLEPLGESFYGITDESGEMLLGRAGSEIQTGMVAGMLEMSNVDLVNEFTDMIVTQRGYQAAARVITTSDELLQETVQLKR